MFEITTEPARRLVRLRLTAMLTREQVSALYREEHAAILAMDCPLGEHLCIVDLTSCPLQLQEGAKAFQSEVGSSAKAKKLAMFTGNALARIQARRIAKERDDVAIFATREEAEDWLFCADSQAAA